MGKINNEQAEQIANFLCGEAKFEDLMQLLQDPHQSTILSEALQGILRNHDSFPEEWAWQFTAAGIILEEDFPENIRMVLETCFGSGSVEYSTLILFWEVDRAMANNEFKPLTKKEIGELVIWIHRHLTGISEQLKTLSEAPVSWGQAKVLTLTGFKEVLEEAGYGEKVDQLISGMTVH